MNNFSCTSGFRQRPKRGKNIHVKLTLTTQIFLLICACLRVKGQFVAFNDTGTAPGTSSNATLYSLSAPTSGLLKNVTNGVNTAVSVAVTGSGTVASSSADNPDPGTPAYNVFSSYVDFTGSPAHYEVAGTDVMTYSFSGLNPGLEYNFQVTAIRGDSSYTDRWTLFELNGTAGFTSKHTSNTLTKAQVPALLTNQVAVNTGFNSSGDLAWWEHIKPSASGTFSVSARQYTGTVPGGSSGGVKAYAGGGFRLEQGGVYSGPTNKPVPIQITNTAAHNINGIKTVFIILMENHDWSTILGSSFCPYINNTLLPMASYCSDYNNPPGNHPSEPNYLWLVAGTEFGIQNDNPPSLNHLSSTNNIFTQLDRAGISWRTYQEDISGNNIPDVNNGQYAVRHNPFVFFDSVRTNLQYCTNHVRPYTELGRDLTNNTVARYNFITPNTTNDMHDLTPGSPSTRKQGDDWLAKEMPKILNSQAYSNGGAVFITWDEGTGTSDGPIGMIVLSPRAKGGGYNSSIHHDHSSTLRTFQNIFGLRPYLEDAAYANDLSDLFKTVQISSVRWVTNSVRITATNLIVGKTNYFQTSTNLSSTNWITIGTSNVATSTSITITNMGLSNIPRRFYRIVELP